MDAMYRINHWKRERGNKYNAKSTIFGGNVHHSKKEAAYARDLDLRLRAKDIAEVRRQVKMPLDVNGYHICNYYIDYVITHNDGTIEYIEVKGFETEVWRLKWKLFEALMGVREDIKLTVVK